MLYYFCIVGQASESCWPVWAWALLCWKITSCESLPDLLDWIVCFGLSCNISLYQTLYCFPFQLRVSKHRSIIIPKIGHHRLSCRSLGVEFLQFQSLQLFLVNCALLSSFKLCFCVMLPENQKYVVFISISLQTLNPGFFMLEFMSSVQLFSYPPHTHSSVVTINQVSRFNVGIKFEIYSAFVTTHLLFLS
jgi:hypothetical protein